MTIEIKKILISIGKLHGQYFAKQRLLLRKVTKGLKVEVVDKNEKPKPKINNQDLAILHKKFANNENDRQYFLDSLYDKYFISRLTHRISIKDGEIKEKKV